MMFQPFAGTRKTERLVNRQVELSRIYNAIYRSKAECHILFLYGPGGMGKSRLAEEVLWRGGNRQMRVQRGFDPEPDQDWRGHKTVQGFTVAYGDLIDLTELRYNTRANLMQAVRDAFTGEGQTSFNDYDRARSNYTSLLQVGADSRMIEEAAKNAEKAFLKDIRECEQDNRLVLILDTAEKLQFGASNELLKAGIIEPDDISYNSVQWLVEIIQKGHWKNTTLILVGRGEEGKEFFETLREACDCTVEPDEIELEPFTEEDVRAYFIQLAEDWAQISDQHADWAFIADQVQWLAGDPDQCWVLWLYTGGQPVRLAMYTDVLVEGHTIPRPLKDTRAEAEERVRPADPIHAPTAELEAAQLEIEKEFISLIFQQPDLRTKILKILVRTPRGLTPEQLVYLLYAPDEVELAAWQPGPEQRKKVDGEIELLLSLSIVKRRPNQRLGLQDEVYKIYARHMRVLLQNKADETRERADLYQKLHLWAQFQVAQQRAKKRVFQEKDERNLRLGSPAKALRAAFDDPGKTERDRRGEVFEAIRTWRLEEIHYYILVDPVEHLNEVLFDLADRYFVSAHENEDSMILTEVDRVLNEEDIRDFVSLKPWAAIEAIGEDAEIALARILRQQEFMQWLRRFVLRKKYETARQYYQKLEDYIQGWPESREKNSFQHTLSANERLGWRLYTDILTGSSIPAAVEKLDKLIAEIIQLIETGQEEYAIHKRGEKGFIDHPALPRLKIILGQLYNFAGYGCACLGYDTRAQDYYAKAIVIFREMKHPQEPTVTNNLSRALSDQGSPYARLVCLDGLTRRRDLSGLDVAYAYSLNTLALIDNDSFRPDLAWQEAAKALAYFRRAQDLRGEGLALLQLAEAQRRLARQEMVVSTFSDEPETIYEQALIAVHRAEGIFENQVPEKVRRIEAYIELGCVHRDLVRFYWQNPGNKNKNYRDALSYLDDAFSLAEEEALTRYQIDTKVNIAWTHYYYQDWDQTEKAIKIAEKLLPADSQIRRGEALPPEERDDVYVYYQRGKLSALAGRMALTRFRQRVDGVRELNSDLGPLARTALVSGDEHAQKQMKAGAQAFALAAGYNWLFSSRSPIVRVVEEPLYAYLKKFNQTELDWFYKDYLGAVEEYGLTHKVFIETLIEKCFGIQKKVKGSENEPQTL